MRCEPARCKDKLAPPTKRGPAKLNAFPSAVTLPPSLPPARRCQLQAQALGMTARGWVWMGRGWTPGLDPGWALDWALDGPLPTFGGKCLHGCQILLTRSLHGLEATVWENLAAPTHIGTIAAPHWAKPRFGRSATTYATILHRWSLAIVRNGPPHYSQRVVQHISAELRRCRLSAPRS